MMEFSELRRQLSKAGGRIPRIAAPHVAGTALAVEPEARQLPVINPATEEPVTRVAETGAGGVDEAVAAAREAFEHGAWPRMATKERQRILRRAAGLIVEHQRELALLESVCAGIPLKHLTGRQIPRAAENFSFFADYIGQMAGETFDQEHGFLTTVTREPAGVAALVSPWNAPLALASMQIASAIAFGNTCISKPSEHTPLSVLRLVELLEEAGLPRGVVNVVNGRGAVTGAALVGHPGIDRIAFTGAAATARSVMAAASARLTPVHFQLGGNSANLVFADADLGRAVDGSLVNAYSNSGQICIAGSRILVQRGIADQFIDRFVTRTSRLRIGDPFDPRTEVGPLAFAAHRDRVLGYFDLARREGAEMLIGGGPAPGFERGYYVSPSAALVESNRLTVCREEVFGPFVTIQVFDEPEEAIDISNDSEYGLVAYAWTSDLALAMKLQHRIRTGTLWVNTTLVRDLRAPFGGFRQSGIGRDGPRHCADFYTEEKSTIIPRSAVTIHKMGADE